MSFWDQTQYPGIEEQLFLKPWESHDAVPLSGVCGWRLPCGGGRGRCWGAGSCRGRAGGNARATTPCSAALPSQPVLTTLCRFFRPIRRKNRPLFRTFWIEKNCWKKKCHKISIYIAREYKSRKSPLLRRSDLFFRICKNPIKFGVDLSVGLSFYLVSFVVGQKSEPSG